MKENIYRKLINYFGNQEKAAIALGISQGTLSGYATGRWGMGAVIALRAEKRTNGEFKAEILCPLLADENEKSPVAANN